MTTQFKEGDRGYVLGFLLGPANNPSAVVRVDEKDSLGLVPLKYLKVL